MATTGQNVRLHPLGILVLALAWLIPGAGHFFLGRRLRAAIIFLTIGGTFWTGMAIGGVMTVDNHNERWWFVAEMFTGIHGLAGWQLHQRQWDRLAADPKIAVTPDETLDFNRLVLMDQRLADEKIALVAPTDTIARAYAGVAGMLNLMCIFDAMMLGLMGIRGEPAPAKESPAEEGQKPC